MVHAVGKESKKNTNKKELYGICRIRKGNVWVHAVGKESKKNTSKKELYVTVDEDRKGNVGCMKWGKV